MLSLKLNFLNFCFTEAEIPTGFMYVEAKYNDKDLYSSKWDLCTVEEGTGSQVLFCPLAVGKHFLVKEMEIPRFLPKVG